MSFESDQNSSDRRSVPQLVPTGEHKGKSPILLNRPVFQIGARESCRIRLMSSTVSQVHAIIIQTRHLTCIRDLCSRTHVYVNGEKVREQLLTDGDRLKIGRFEFIYRSSKRYHGDEPPALPATLEVTGSPIPVPIDQRVVLIGRRMIADIPLLEESVSNAHAVIFAWEGKRFIRDLGSRTGTFRNGKKIHEKELKAGDVIQVGETEIRYTPSTEMASVEIIDSATDSQIAAAPSAEEVDFGANLAGDLAGAARAATNRKAVEPDFSKLSDTVPVDDAVHPSHHDTAMIPLSFSRGDLADTSSGSAHGLEMIPDNKSAEEPMPRSWRDSSNTELPPISIDLPIGQPIVPAEPFVHDEVTDLGLTSDLADLSPTFPPADPVELPAFDEPVEGNATLDLSIADFPSSEPELSSAPPVEEVSELPLIASEPTDAAIDIVETQVEVPEEPVIEIPTVEIPIVETPVPEEQIIDAISLVEEAPPVIESENVEVIEPTEPTPESALNLTDAPIDDTLTIVEPDPLSDTNFNRQVNDFTGPSAGEIVEPEAVVSEQIAPESPLEVVDEVPAEQPVEVEAPAVDEATIELTPDAESLDPVNLDDLALDAVNETEPELNLDITTESDAPAEVVNLDALTADAVDEPEVLQPVEDSTAEVTPPLDLSPEIPQPVEPEINLEIACDPDAPAEVVNLDDLAMDALNEPAEPIAPMEFDVSEAIAEETAIEPVLEEQSPPQQMFGSTMPEPVETTSELQISDEPIAEPVVEGSATITPMDEPAAEATTASETTTDGPIETIGETTADLTAEDLISPPIEPLGPDLHEIDLGLEPLPDLPTELPELPAGNEAAGFSLSGGSLSGDTASPSGDAISFTDFGGASPAIQTPFEIPAADIPLPPRPLIKRRDRDKPTVIRKFGQETSEASTNGPVESPFAGAKAGEEAKIQEFPTSPEGSVDVFGSTSPATADDLLSSLSGKLSETAEAPQPAANRRRRPTDPSHRMAPRPVQAINENGAPRRPAFAYNDSPASHADGEAKRRKLLKRIPVVLIVGLILALGAAAAAYFYVPIVYEIQASVRFGNLQSQSRSMQQMFQQNTISELFKEPSRRAALQKLRDRYPQIAPGFLDDADEYVQAVARTDWSNKQPGLLTILYSGKDKTEDTARLLAVGLGIYQNNSDLAMRAKDAARNLAEITRIGERAATQIADLTEQMEKDRLVAERYQPEKLAAATTQVQQLEKLYNDSIATLKGTQAELDRLKKLSPTAPVTQPGDAAQPAADQELNDLTKKAEEMAVKLAQARQERADLAKQARESLDAAYEQFQKQIASAQATTQGGTQQSPELARFVDTAQAQLKTIREMTDDFIASQQAEYQQLAEIKAKLDEKMQSRRADLWVKDEQLQKWAEQREITVRKLNAAKSDNLEKEVADLETDLNLIEVSIKARQDVLATDPLYADVINSLQQIIETKQKQFVENRKKTDEKLNDFQRQLAASLPTVEKLPQEQQALAVDMKARLADIDSARRQYAAAADSAGLENDVVLKNMTQQLASMQGDIEVRKQQMLAAANGAVARHVTEQIAAKEQELAALTVQNEKAQQSFFAAQAQQRELTQARANAEEAMNRRYEARKKLDLLDAQKMQADRDLKTKQDAVATAITPVEPTEEDVIIRSVSDKRTVASITSGAGVLLLAGIYSLLLAYAAAKANPFPHHNVEPEELAKEEEPQENQPAVV